LILRSAGITFVKIFRLKHLFLSTNPASVFYTFLFCIAVHLPVGCTNTAQFEKNEQIPNHEWSYSLQPELVFDIKDTSSVYNVLVTLRHTDAYAYRNLWLYISSKQPGDSTFGKERFELNLQDESGRWIGSGANDVHEVRYPLFTNIRFTKQGTYTIRLQQTMRDNPLQHIMNAGIRIEKAKQ
jgi:gliding motility-associated lipoprotein GldH